MAKTLHLDIVTPDGSAFSGEVETVVVPAMEGLLGVLPRHAPMMAALSAGELRYRAEGKDQRLAISGGFAQIEPHKVVVLADTAELAHQIDEARAKARLEQKQQALKGVALIDEAQVLAMQASLLKELVRIKVAEKGKRS